MTQNQQIPGIRQTLQFLQLRRYGTHRNQLGPLNPRQSKFLRLPHINQSCLFSII